MEFEEFKKRYIELYPEIRILYGPYIRKTDNRKIITVHFYDGKCSSKQYAKALYEVYIGQKLGYDDTIDHIDGNLTNDDIENLQIITRVDNAKKSAKHLLLIFDNCVYCGKEFQLSSSQINNYKSKWHKNSAGPFCSRQCSGKYGKAIQENRIARFDSRPHYNPQYYSLQDNYSK